MEKYGAEKIIEDFHAKGDDVIRKNYVVQGSWENLSDFLHL